jgi:hypothetical protein
MLKKLLISLQFIFVISLTNCGRESSKEAKELLNQILQFIGIPYSIIVNVCQDANSDGICGAKELFTKLIINKSEMIDNIWKKIEVSAEGQYFLENINPNLPILVELQDVANVHQDEGKFTLPFNSLTNQEQNGTKEVSILESMVDADALKKIEADRFRTLNNTEAQNKYYATLLNGLESNINILRTNELDSKKSVITSIKEMANVIKVNPERADAINRCDNNQTCVDEEIKKISNALIITEDKLIEITGKKEVNYDKWTKPSQSNCENNGGVYNRDGDNNCRANWENSNSICNTMGDKLPDIERLRKIITDCGGIPHTWGEDDYKSKNNKNIANKSYQACYQEKGFTSNFYWSSTMHILDNSSAWNIYFYEGNDDWDDKMNEFCIRCIKSRE